MKKTMSKDEAIEALKPLLVHQSRYPGKDDQVFHQSPTGTVTFGQLREAVSVIYGQETT